MIISGLKPREFCNTGKMTRTLAPGTPTQESLAMQKAQAKKAKLAGSGIGIPNILRRVIAVITMVRSSPSIWILLVVGMTRRVSWGSWVVFSVH